MQRKLKQKSRMMSQITAMATLTTLFTMSPDAIAQFKKFKSQTRHKSGQVQKKNPANNFASPNSSTSQSKQDADTFGTRVTGEPSPKNSKYVNLNPETAFGPEIITSFDFPDTDIMVMTRHMQKLTGINLILDKDVKGKVSITAPTAITVGDAWKAYLAALNMAGYTLVKSGAFYKIINARDVRYVPTEIYTGSYTPNTESHMMKVLALKNVDASEISRNFRPFMSRYGRIIDIKQTNTIIISDTGSNIARLERLIKFLDVPGYEESLQILPVKNTSAQEIAKLLDQILKTGKSGGTSTRRSSSASTSSRFSGSGSAKGGQNISKIIAEPRTNSIIAMANAEGARQLRELIKKLDTQIVSTNSDKIHVHYLNYGNAEELSKTLSSLVSGSSASRSSSTRPGGARSFTPASSGSTLFNGEVKVTADKNNNALVVTASPTDWLTLKSVISKLDIPRDQVYVEGMILETTLTKVRAFGTEFLGAYGRGNAQRGGFTNGGGLTDLLGGNPTSLSGFFVGGGAGGTVEIPNPAGGDPLVVNSVSGLLRAISSNAATNVLSTPQILALDNTEAEFEVGSTVPVQNQVTNSNGTTSSNTTNQEAKLSLKITPQINKVTRFVKLKINQSVNEFQGQAEPGVSGRPTTVRTAITEVIVRDKDTIAMGGLLRNRETITHNKIPLLGDIPVLGWLFKNKRKDVEKVNLLMFMTPSIISPYEEEASKITGSAISKARQAIKEEMVGDEKIPFHKTFDKIEQKVKRQQTEALYNTDNENEFQKTNDSNGIGGRL
jgi:general secretion pathway protein D